MGRVLSHTSVLLRNLKLYVMDKKHPELGMWNCVHQKCIELDKVKKTQNWVMPTCSSSAVRRALQCDQHSHSKVLRIDMK